MFKGDGKKQLHSCLCWCGRKSESGNGCLLLVAARKCSFDPYYLAGMRQLHPYPEEGIMEESDVTTLNKELGDHMKAFQHPRLVQ